MIVKKFAANVAGVLRNATCFRNRSQPSRNLPVKLSRSEFNRYQAAAQAIREAITMGALQPGQRLTEQKLAASLGIGQPTLREALKELEYEGFVRKIPQKGTYITTFDKKDCRELRELSVSMHD
jgi:DNA-binding GntR family transcriptional regulator